MLLKLLRWLMGYVVFVSNGIFAERFMNLTARSQISLWDVKKRIGEFVGSMSASDYRDIKNIARKSGVKIRIKEKHGLPFIINKYRNRVGLPIGVACFFAIIYFLSMYVWSIDVSGNVGISSDEIKNVVAELGLSEGTLKRELDIPMMEQSAMIKLPGTAWLSINIEGSCATISVKERIAPPNIVPNDKPCNIKATCDGQIDRMEVYDGTALVKSGDAVIKGQLLVSGVVEDVYGGNTLHHANAKVFAYTRDHMREEHSLKQVEYIPTGKAVVRKRAKLFGIDVPLTLVPIPGKDYKKESRHDEVRIAGAKLPFDFYTERWLEQREKKYELTKEQAFDIIKSRICNMEKNIMKDIEIIEKKETQLCDGDKCIIDVDYYCKKDISGEEEIIIK